MALIFADSFHHYDTTNPPLNSNEYTPLQSKFWVGLNRDTWAGIGVATIEGRRWYGWGDDLDSDGTKSPTFSPNFVSAPFSYLTDTDATAGNVVTCGVNVYFSSNEWPNSGNGRGSVGWTIPFHFYSGTTQLATIELRQTNDDLGFYQRVVAQRTGGSSAQGTTPLPLQRSFYLEAQIKIDNPGWIKVWINDVLEAELTLAEAALAIDRFRMGGTFNWAEKRVYYENFYILDDTVSGSPNGDLTDRLGPTAIHSGIPDSDLTGSGWTGTGGSPKLNLHQEINDPNVPDGTTYISANTTGSQQLFNVTFPTLQNPAHFLKTWTAAKQSEAGLNQLRHLNKHNATTEEGPIQEIYGGKYYYVETYNTSLADGATLSSTNLNAAEYGVKVEKL